MPTLTVHRVITTPITVKVGNRCPNRKCRADLRRPSALQLYYRRAAVLPGRLPRGPEDTGGTWDEEDESGAFRELEMGYTDCDGGDLPVDLVECAKCGRTIATANPPPPRGAESQADSINGG